MFQNPKFSAILASKDANDFIAKMEFERTATDSGTKARAGLIKTDHGNVPTPVFMPVGTAGTVKGIHMQELENANANIILGNTYHLFLRPGLEILQAAGGLHHFNGWRQPILTDSGGYQVFSLAERRQITEEGVMFQSHIDGSYHQFTPENTIDIQRAIGADIIMALDECTPYPCDYAYAKDSMKRTHRWLSRGIQKFDKSFSLYDYRQSLFPIVQGSTFKDLRQQSAEFVAEQQLAGNAIGGLSVGEPAEDMYAMTEVACDILPQTAPRYLMGVGTPANMLEAISLGVDMFDCVMPTRNGRNGMVFTKQGIINIKNRKWAKDFSPIDHEGETPVARQHTKAYLRHLIISKEMLGSQIASLTNISLYIWLMAEARQQIGKGTFHRWKEEMIPRLMQRL